MPASAARIADSDGWLVIPAIGAAAPSTASTPASTAARIGRERAAGGVVGVQVHGQRRSARAAPSTSVLRGGRAQQARHVLDREHVHAGRDQLLGQAQVVVERVDPLAQGCERSPV